MWGLGSGYNSIPGFYSHPASIRINMVHVTGLSVLMITTLATELLLAPGCLMVLIYVKHFIRLLLSLRYTVPWEEHHP